jgi:hypothetical protein
MFSYSQIWLNLALDLSPLWLHHNIDNNNNKIEKLINYKNYKKNTTTNWLELRSVLVANY